MSSIHTRAVYLTMLEKTVCLKNHRLGLLSASPHIFKFKVIMNAINMIFIIKLNMHSHL